MPDRRFTVKAYVRDLNDFSKTSEELTNSAVEGLSTAAGSINAAMLIRGISAASFPDNRALHKGEIEVTDSKFTYLEHEIALNQIKGMLVLKDFLFIPIWRIVVWTNDTAFPYKHFLP